MATNTALNMKKTLPRLRVKDQLIEGIDEVHTEEMQKTKNPRLNRADVRRMLYELGIKAYKQQQTQTAA